MVLIVDDDAHVREFLHLAFVANGFKAISCDSGEQALRLVKKSLPDLIVLDAIMPKLDGYQVMWHLQNDPDTRKIPTMFLTSRDRAQDVDFGIDLGAKHYMTKPFQMADVIAQANRLLKGSPEVSALN